MRVRLAIEEDLPDIVDMARTNCAISTPYLEFSEEKVEESFRNYIERCDTTFFVAEDESGVVGLLVTTINEYRHASGIFVTQEVLFVKPEKRGSRAAAALTKELIVWAKHLGAIEITGGNDNKFQSERTARFLAHFGFEQVGFFMRRMLTDG
jgi:L-amino acid N-acyltransferase YncA